MSKARKMDRIIEVFQQTPILSKVAVIIGLCLFFATIVGIIAIVSWFVSSVLLAISRGDAFVILATFVAGLVIGSYWKISNKRLK